MKLIGMCCQVSPLDSISYNLLTNVLRQVRTPDATIFNMSGLRQSRLQG